MQIRFKNTFGYTSRDINEPITIDDSVIIGAITAVTSEDVEATIYDCPMGAEWVELFKSRLAEVGAIFDNDTNCEVQAPRRKMRCQNRCIVFLSKHK